jgi:glycosyltransferase involved in cell wall biosynthesis
VIDDNVTGIMFPQGDYAALERTLLRLVEDSALRNQVGAQAKQAVFKRHTWAANARSVVRLALGESSPRTFAQMKQLDCDSQ